MAEVASTTTTAEPPEASGSSATTNQERAPAVNETVDETVAPEEAEPQNPLTQKFTEQEWSALKEFRVRYGTGQDVQLLVYTLTERATCYVAGCI